MDRASGVAHVDEAREHVATLVRIVPVRLIEVSRGDCRLESPARIEPGLSGQLSVELQGVACMDDIRITRCQRRVGGSEVYQVGAELLKTRPLSRRSVRLAVRQIIGCHARGQRRNHDTVHGNDLPAEDTSKTPA